MSAKVEYRQHNQPSGSDTVEIWFGTEGVK